MGTILIVMALVVILPGSIFLFLKITLPENSAWQRWRERVRARADRADWERHLQQFPAANTSNAQSAEAGKECRHTDLPHEPEIPMEFSIAEAGFKCPVCNGLVDKEAEVVKCSKCQTPAHKDCFEFNGKCGVFACDNKTSTPMICGPCEARHRDEQDPFRAYDALTYDHDYLHWRKSCPHYK